MSFELDAFMKRVDESTNPQELDTLGSELVKYADTLSKSDRQALVNSYMGKMRERSQPIMNKIDEMRKK